YRCEQQHLPLESMMQVLVTEYRTNVYYFFLARGHCSTRYRVSLCSQRVEGTPSRERASSLAPQASGNSQPIIVQKCLESQKQHDSTTYGRSDASHMRIRMAKAYVPRAQRCSLFYHQRPLRTWAL